MKVEGQGEEERGNESEGGKRQENDDGEEGRKRQRRATRWDDDAEGNKGEATPAWRIPQRPANSLGHRQRMRKYAAQQPPFLLLFSMY